MGSEFMTERSYNNPSIELNYFSFGIILGAALGVVIGAALGSFLLPTALGVGLGLIISDAIYRRMITKSS